MGAMALVLLQKFPIDCNIFQWKCPLQNENGLALSKIQFHAWKNGVNPYSFIVFCVLFSGLLILVH